MTTRFIYFFFCVIFSTNLAQAQENKEIGLRMSGFTEIGAIYKKKKGNQKYFRISTAVANLNASFTSEGSEVNYSGSIGVGVETRMRLNNKLLAIRGTQFFAHVINSRRENRKLYNISAGLGFIFGLQYALSNDFYVSIEMIPNIGISTISDKDKIVGVRAYAHFDMDPVTITLAHQF